MFHDKTYFFYNYQTKQKFGKHAFEKVFKYEILYESYLSILNFTILNLNSEQISNLTSFFRKVSYICFIQRI